MMTPATTVELDEAELLHLALHAMGNDRHEESMQLLKRTLHAFPASARARYLLGAEHAQIGLYDRAVAEMTEAVKLDPSLAVAHFQLGLLHVTAGRVREAQAAWLPLDRLAPDDPLRLFKSAMLHLVHNEFAACIENLEAGIAHNKLNKPLNDDMRRLLADVQTRQTGPGAANGDTPGPQVPPPTKNMLLSTYDRNRDDTSTD
jgi:tetratricopeptide (TPR) repeat protein